jgi:hypothetical protein
LIQQEILLSHLLSRRYGINPKLIDILHNSETNNLNKIATALLGPVEPVIETRQFLDNEEKKLRHTIIDTGFLGIDISDNECLSLVFIT